MQTIDHGLTVVWEGKAVLGEGPVWDHRDNRLVFVDIMGEKVHILDPVSGRDRTIPIGQKVGAAVPDLYGGMVLALEHGFHRLGAHYQVLPIRDPESDKPGNRFNDGKCDAAGRFWAGTMDRKEERPTGALYCMETNGDVRKVLEGVTVSNGLTWSRDNRTMYYIDSPTKRVLAYDFQLESGELANPRVVVVIPEDEGFPDGMTVDGEGMLWIAQWEGWQVSRWNPDTGEKIGFVPVPVARPTSCAFGGDNYETLFITSARVGLNEEQLADQPHAGDVFSIKPGISGWPACFYQGSCG